MNSMTQTGYLMHDPYVRRTDDPWAAAPAAQSPAQSTPAQEAQSDAPAQTRHADAARLQHGLSPQVIGNPMTAEEAYLGSMQAMLAREIGAYIAATFLVGTAQLLRSEGQLTEVGNNYITIYQADRDRYVVGDLNSLRFVEFFEDSSMRAALQAVSPLSATW